MAFKSSILPTKPQQILYSTIKLKLELNHAINAMKINKNRQLRHTKIMQLSPELFIITEFEIVEIRYIIRTSWRDNST